VLPLPAFDCAAVLDPVPRLAVAHDHNQRYARKTLSDRRACASHGYIGASDDAATELAKLAAFESRIPPNASVKQPCAINSCTTHTVLLPISVRVF